MLNERDGGIGGVSWWSTNGETGYDTKRGGECYDAVQVENRSSSIPGQPASRCR